MVWVNFIVLMTEEFICRKRYYIMIYLSNADGSGSSGTIYEAPHRGRALV